MLCKNDYHKCHAGNIEKVLLLGQESRAQPLIKLWTRLIGNMILEELEYSNNNNNNNNGNTMAYRQHSLSIYHVSDTGLSTCRELFPLTLITIQ